MHAAYVEPYLRHTTRARCYSYTDTRCCHDASWLRFIRAAMPFLFQRRLARSPCLMPPPLLLASASGARSVICCHAMFYMLSYHHDAADNEYTLIIFCYAEMARIRQALCLFMLCALRAAACVCRLMLWFAAP